jgi:dienelactone hydrolase
MRRLFLAPLLALALVPFVRADEKTPAPKHVLVGQLGDSFLEEIDGQRVLHLTGEPYSMGLAHGKLLGKEVREDVDAYLKDFAFGRMHYTMEYLQGIWAKAKPFVPAEYLEEMAGIAKNSGVALEELEAVHIIPELHHCSGAAAFGKATKDGKLYHYRSLDYSLGLGSKKKVQENACLIVRKPTKGYATVTVGWAGTLGCVTGMNDQGISIGEMGSENFSETFEGTPMWFRVRWILENARSLDQGLVGFSEWKRTCGYNFIITDGKIPDARAVEVDRQRCAFFAPGGAEENVAPHEAIPFVVRRTNHYVDRELASRQRNTYDPRENEKGSYSAYERISKYLKEHSGKLDGESMIELCQGYSKDAHCLHQAVFCTSDLRFWVSNAKDPEKAEHAGAQNQTFHPYDLTQLLASDARRVALEGAARSLDEHLKEGQELQAKLEGFEKELANLAQRIEGGLERARDRIIEAPTGEATEPALEAPEDDAAWTALSFFKRPAGKFPYNLVEKEKHATFVRHELVYPSSAHTTDESDLVYGVYYQPAKPTSERAPAAVIVHHLGGSFEAEEILAQFLAQHGVPACTLALPGYGKRRAPGQPRAGFLGHEDPIDDFRGMRQAVLDVRRAADFLRSRPEVDPERVGVAGVSLGALVASDAAGIDPRFARAVFIIGGGDFLKVLNNGSAEAREAMEEMNKRKIPLEQLKKGFDLVDPLTFAHRLRSQDVLMLNAEKDEIFPRESTLELWRKAGYPRIKWYNSTHTGIAAHLGDVMNETLDHLRSKAEPREPD